MSGKVALATPDRRLCRNVIFNRVKEKGKESEVSLTLREEKRYRVKEKGKESGVSLTLRKETTYRVKEKGKESEASLTLRKETTY